MKAKVSVIIPVYNTPELYLRTCLESVLEQGLQEIEVICLDDCSTDGSLEVLEGYAQKDSRVILVKNQENMGVSRNRNQGAALVTGEYLYFMDCDDYIDETAFEKLYAMAKEKNLDTVLFQSELIYESEEIASKFSRKAMGISYDQSIKEVKTGIEWFSVLEETGSYNTPVWLQLIKTSYFHENNLHFPPLTSCTGEDEIFTLYNFLAAERLAGLPETLYHYRIRGGSDSTQKKTYAFIEGYTSTYMYMLLAIKEQNIPPDKIEPFERYLEMFALTVAKSYYKITEKDPTLVEETLLNLKNIMFEHPLIALPTWENFFQKRAETKELCFFGAGIECKVALSLFQKQGATPPVVICDNSPKLQGTFVQGIPVLSFIDCLKECPDAMFLITNRRFYFTIKNQVEEAMGENRILKFSF